MMTKCRETLFMRLIHLALLLVLVASPALADTPASLFDPARHMHVSEVKPGMKGYGLSVFKGTKIERFDVEVISVLKDFNPRYDVVLINCHGQNLDHTGAIAGMSGSPVFLRDDQGRDRMIGAFAYGFPMAKDAIAGVQPIEYMLNLPTTRPSPTISAGTATADVKSGPNAEKKLAWSLRDAVLLPGMKNAPRNFPLASRTSMLPNPTLSGGLDDSARLQPLMTPLMVSGVSSKVLEQFGPLFEAYRFHLLQSGVGGGAAAQGDVAPLEPGSVLAAPLITGDMELVATGTCTEKLGDRVFAFGHAFNGEGAIDIPMASGQINGIVATLVSSFKIGSMTKVQGALVSDQVVGVAGRLGSAPQTVPINLRLVYSDGSTDVTYHFNALRHPRFTPLITGLAVSSVLTGEHDLPQYHTVDYDVTIDFNGRPVHVQNSAVNAQPQDLFMEFATPIIAAAENPFERVMPTSINGTITVSPAAREAQILSVNMPKLKYRPGETVHGYISYRPFHAAEATMPIKFDLPKDLSDGTYSLVVSDAERYLTDEQQSKPFRFEAGSIGDVFSVLDELEKIRRSAIYVRLVREADGVAVGRTEMPRLPAAMRGVLLESGRSNTTAFVSSDVKSIPTQLVMSGSAEFELTIDNELRIEVGNNPPTHAEPGKTAGAAAAVQKSEEPKKSKTMPLPTQP
ncbi:MAG TPA: hypothetical protein VHS31_08300 [Tepidisphaeraceae bacterium]|jgi:hypothetical protein|nr:hypothetical protein [Tepidisphaeraceae bacterium]